MPRREPLNRAKVLAAGVALADRSGVESVSMRNLAQDLGVVPMALYKHVSDKEELLDGMVDVVIGEIGPAVAAPEWKTAVRGRVLDARRALLRHPWASRVIETRTKASVVALDYMDSLIGLFLAGGLTADQAHHAMHALGSRMWGFTQEVFPISAPSEPMADLAARYPNIITIAAAANHAGGCDGQVEFEFALDVILDGVERLHRASWSSES